MPGTVSPSSNNSSQYFRSFIVNSSEIPVRGSIRPETQNFVVLFSTKCFHFDRLFGIMFVAVNSPLFYTPKNMPATNALLQEGRYRINNEFPHEGSGTVYDAYDTVSETNVIVKEIPVKLNKVATISQRENVNIAFADQAKVLTEIQHDSLLHIRGYFSEIGRQYLVMESVDGDDLQALLDRQKSCFPVSDVANWADQVLDALNYLHTFKTPIVHRNIRPENIKLNSNGKIKLMSLGFADGDAQVNTANAENGSDGPGIAYSPLEQLWNGLDAASQKVITNKYDERSERILKEDLDARSDIYSLGATLYHLITARVPVDSLERSIEILEGRPDPLRSPNKVDPNIPPEISDVIFKALEIKREYRFDSAAIMRQVLKTALVRVKERETEEALEEKEAADDIRLAEQKRQQSVVPQELSETERIKQQLLEAEAQRLVAEQRAAEAERKLHESEAANRAKTEPTVAAVNFDDDLLGVLGPSVHVSEAPKSHREDISFADLADDAEDSRAAIKEPKMRSEEVVENYGDPVEDESNIKDETVESATETALSAGEHADEEAASSSTEDHEFSENGLAEEKSTESAEEISFSEDESVEEVQPESVAEEVTVSAQVADDENIDEPAGKDLAAIEDHPVVEESIETVSEEVAVTAPSLMSAAEPPKVLDEIYMVPVKNGGFLLGMPAIGIGAAVLVVIAIGAWMLLSGTAEPAKTVTETPAATQTAPTDPAVKSGFQASDVPADQPASTQPDPAALTPISQEPTTVKAVTAATPKPKKAAPDKTPAPKKAVTVDDLINDN